MVVVYVTTAIGIPVYMHYCGGELETVSFLVKDDSCCGEEEEMPSDCCDNEDTFARYAPDFTAKKINSGSDFKIPSIDLMFRTTFSESQIGLYEMNISFDFFIPPPKLLQTDIVKTSVLRI